MNDINKTLYKNRHIFKSEQAKKMKEFVQHNNVNTYRHCFNVLRVSLKINEFLKLNSDLDTLILGAFLHDFYLYDWHDKDMCKKLHGFVHPKIAADNSEKFFNINEDVKTVIIRHMWPLTITKIPNTKEAIVVCIADKICSLMEVFSV